MNYNKNDVKVSLYSFCLFVLTFTYALSSIYIFSQNDVVHNINIFVQFLIYPILLFLITKCKYSLKQIIIILLVGIILTLEFCHNHSTNWLRYLLLFTASKNTNFTKIVKTLLLAFSSVFLLSLFLYIFGISNAGIGRREAVSLGFSQPNIATMFIVTIFFLILALQTELTTQWIFLLFVVAAFVGLILKTQTAVIIFITFPIVYIWVKTGVKKNRLISKNLMKGSQLIAFTITCILLYVYPKPYYTPFRTIVDQIFTYRPYLNYNNVMKYGITLFGQNVNITDTVNYAYNYFGGFISNQRYNTVDSSYVTQVIGIGIITIIPMFIFYIKMVEKAIVKQRYMIITIAIMCSWYAFVENNYNEAYYFFPFFYLMSIDNFPSVQYKSLTSKYKKV